MAEQKVCRIKFSNEVLIQHAIKFSFYGHFYKSKELSHLGLGLPVSLILTLFWNLQLSLPMITLAESCQYKKKITVTYFDGYLCKQNAIASGW